jgi:hypothetical protein
MLKLKHPYSWYDVNSCIKCHKNYSRVSRVAPTWHLAQPSFFKMINLPNIGKMWLLKLLPGRCWEDGWIHHFSLRVRLIDSSCACHFYNSAFSSTNYWERKWIALVLAWIELLPLAEGRTLPPVLFAFLDICILFSCFCHHSPTLSLPSNPIM